MLAPPPRGLIGEEVQCEAFVFIKCLPRAFLYIPLYFGFFFEGGQEVCLVMTTGVPGSIRKILPLFCHRSQAELKARNEERKCL